MITSESLDKYSEEDMTRLRRDVRKTAITMSEGEVRYLVDMYYTMQGYRIATNNQTSALSKSGEPHEVIALNTARMGLLERDMALALAGYAESNDLGRWAMSNVGIGPIITAGLLAHIDLGKAKSPSAIWRFAGLDPTQKWEKGQKRPWNASLKVLCWKIGQSFMKLHNNDDCFYGKIYKTRKLLEIERNESGANAATAASTLEQKSFKRDTTTKTAYQAGKLPDGRIELRAERFAVKLFLSHYWQVGYEMANKTAAPKPWIIQHGGHVDLIPPPNWPMES